MRAIVLPEYGPASKLVLRDLPEPEPGPDEVKVRVAGASVNPIDWKLRSGAYKAYVTLELPVVFGRDVAGEVVAVGAGVTWPRLGARVLGFVNHGYAEFVVAPVSAWAEVPSRLDIVDAAALPLVLLTGAQLIEEAGEVRAGENVLVTGATGSVGRVAVFAAKERGAKVYAGVRGTHAAEAGKLGVAGVVALDDDRELETLPPLDVLADTVGGPTTQKLLGRMKPDGRIASAVGEPPGAKERGLVVRAFMTHPDSARLGALAEQVAAGRLVIPISRRFALAEAARAHELAEQGGAGKVLLRL